MGRKPRGGGKEAADGKEGGALMAGCMGGSGGVRGRGSSSATVGVDGGDLVTVPLGIADDVKAGGSSIYCSIDEGGELCGVPGVDPGALTALGGGVGAMAVAVVGGQAGDWVAEVKGLTCGRPRLKLSPWMAAVAEKLEAAGVADGVNVSVMGAASGNGVAVGLLEVREMEVTRGLAGGATVDFGGGGVTARLDSVLVALGSPVGGGGGGGLTAGVIGVGHLVGGLGGDIGFDPSSTSLDKCCPQCVCAFASTSLCMSPLAPCLSLEPACRAGLATSSVAASSTRVASSPVGDAPCGLPPPSSSFQRTLPKQWTVKHCRELVFTDSWSDFVAEDGVRI